MRATRYDGERDQVRATYANLRRSGHPLADDLPGPATRRSLRDSINDTSKT